MAQSMTSLSPMTSLSGMGERIPRLSQKDRYLLLYAFSCAATSCKRAMQAVHDREQMKARMATGDRDFL